MLKITSFSFLIISFLLSCRGIKTIPDSYAKPQERTRDLLAIFMDGTRDMPHRKKCKNTNVWKTHSLAFTGIGKLYVEGVGAGNVVKDAIYATTTKERIMRAYRFLAENYKTGDSICLFGFSRGANQCRILSSLIYTVGIISLKPIKEESEKEKLLLDLYDLYNVTEASVKKIRLAEYLEGKGLQADTSGTTMIELMGLWDTVEAFVVDDELEISTPLPQHLNQLYNVKKLFHAVSLDDNRAYNYSPILATHNDVAFNPQQVPDSIVEEVWFNGSHKNVGGGAGKKKNDQLSSISLKWMWSRVEPYHIFRDTVFEINTLGNVTDMRSTWYYRKLSPGDTLRGINKYWESMNVNWNNHRIKVHQSVIDRLAAGVVQDFKLWKDGLPRLDWYDWEPFKQCFDTVPGNKTKRIFRKENCPCIEVVNDCGANN